MSNNGSVLHSLCQEGNLAKVGDYFSRLSPDANVCAILNRPEGLFGYTPLHLAAANGHFAVLQLLLSKGGNVNATSNRGATPLHLAATHNRVECVNVLIEYNANTSMLGPGGKTAKEMTALKAVARSLCSAELVDAAENNDGGVEKVLENQDQEIHPCCLSRAFVAAVEKKQYRNAHHLLLKGASSFAIDQALTKVEKSEVEYVKLVLAKAAVSNNCDLLAEVCDPSKESAEPNIYLEWIEQKKVPLEVPLKISRQRGNMAVWEKLMLMLESDGSVRWSGLQMSELNEDLLRKIRDVKYLFLDRNMLKSLPQEMENFKQVRRLDLQANELSFIPDSLLCLPSVNILNLSNNKLTRLPELSDWSPSLTELNLSQNKLSDIPGNPKAPKLRNLYLSGNELATVPSCVCNFVTLLTLDISDNKIQVLPEEMGSLEKLITLEVKGLKLKEPPAQYLKSAEDCVRYLKNKVCKAKPFYSMKLMLVGNGNRGKTTLVARLQGKDCGNEATVGVDISEWECSEGQKTFHFSIWDFAGQEEYYATHQCFLSDCSIYLVLFNLMDDRSALAEIEPWLSNIALRAKDSRVHIVGTHLDEVPQEQRQEVGHLLESVQRLAELYIRHAEVHAVALKGNFENVDKLVKSIYRSASEYKVNGKAVMGQEVPESYHKLYGHFKKEVAASVRKGTCQPVMLADEYLSEVEKFYNSPDGKELASVTTFLINAGALLHYDDRSNNLHELYFVDPSWLCDMMSSIVAVKNKNPFVRDGILLFENIPQVLRNERFHSKYFAQYLTLLDRFEIAFAIDSRSILIPSLLPDRRPQNISIFDADGTFTPHTRYIIFNRSTTPHGLWSRLVSRIMHSVSQIKYVMDKEVKNSSTTEAVASLFGGIPQLPPSAECSYVDISQVRLEFWKNGIFYSDPDVAFLVESLKKSSQNHLDKEGILISTSSTRLGRSLYGQLIDMAVVLCDNLFSDRIQCTQLIPCSTCVQRHETPPATISVEHCRSLSATGQETVVCQRGHRLALPDIIPDQLLCDLDPRFLLNSSEIICGTEVLGKGGQGCVYGGTCRGLPVAIKKYSQDSLPDSSQFSQLRKEVLLFQKLHHPCLLNLVGVCVHPTMDVVLERAPLGSLQDCLVSRQLPVHRIVVHRIAAQVASALRAIHNMGIIYRDLKAANVLVWSLDPESLCHCKLTDFGTAIEQTPFGSRDRVEGTRGFTAPEVLGKDGSTSIYNHLSDVFSFAMLLYQMIAQREPFHDYKDGLGKNVAVVKGERPKLQDVPRAETMYYYLTRLMQSCWKEEPAQRPTTDQIVTKTCLSTMQSTLCVLPIHNGLGLRPSCIVPQSELTRAGMTCDCSELWICSTEKGGDGTEVDIYPIATMKSRAHFVVRHTVQCIAVCGGLVWISLRSGIEHGVIQMFDVCTGAHVHEIVMKQDIVGCIASSERFVYCGTLEGSCILFPRDVETLKSGSPLVSSKISEGCVDGIVVTSDAIWVSHTKHIHLLDLETLEVLDHITNSMPKKVEKSETFSRQKRYNTPKRSVTCTRGEKKASNKLQVHVGSMKVSADGSTVWSCQLLHSSTVSMWSVSNRCLVSNVAVEALMVGIVQDPIKEVRVTTFAPVLDTLWVGLYTGHILVLDRESVLMWFQPYSLYIRFLECVLCEPERAIVLSGAKGFILALDDELAGKNDPGEPGTVVLWEGYRSKLCRQIQLVQEESSTFLGSHDTVRKLIFKGLFKDGTQLLSPIHDPSPVSN